MPFVIAAVLALTPPLTDVVALPLWMSGCWEQVSSTDWVEECWTEPRGGLMLGSSRTGAGQRASSYELMFIEGRFGDAEFCAAPNGADQTCFEKARETPTEIVFVNTKHDYPQRIRYWREGKDLLAETSLADGSKAQRWRYAPKGY